MKKCPYCGTLAEVDNLFCTECGKPFPQVLECPHCGASISVDDSFCCSCGKKVDEQPASGISKSLQKKCPHCGTSVSNDDTFCQNCGIKIEEESLHVNMDTQYDAGASSDDDVRIKENDNSLDIESELVSYSEANTDNTFSSYMYNKILYILFAFALIGGIWFCYNTFFKHSPAIDSSVELASLAEYKDKNVKYIISDYDNHVISPGEFEFEAQLIDAENNIYTKTYKIAISNKKVILSDGDYEYFGEVHDNMIIEVSYAYNDDIHYHIILSPTNREGTEWKGEYQSNAKHHNIVLKQKSASILSANMLQKITDASKKQIDNQTEEEDKNELTNNLSWLQGHWVYDVDLSTDRHYRIHVLIAGSRISQYRKNPSESTNPSFTIEDGKINAQYEPGILTYYIIDPARQSISIDDGRRWMYKLGTDEEIRHRAGFESEETFFIKITNQLFRSNDGNEIRFDKNRRVYFNDVYAGTIEIETLEKVKAIVRYSGGDCEEGKLEIDTDLMTKNYLMVMKIPFDHFYSQVRD